MAIIFSLIKQLFRSSKQLVDLRSYSRDDLAAYGIEHCAELEYRVELSRRIAQTFGNADTLTIFDNIVCSVATRMISGSVPDTNRSLSTALWLSTGFIQGGKVLLYAPPNPVEIKSYLILKKMLEERLQRQIPVQILYETEDGNLIDILNIYLQNSSNYNKMCEQFSQRPSNTLIADFHFYLDLIKRHYDTITRGGTLTLKYF